VLAQASTPGTVSAEELVLAGGIGRDLEPDGDLGQHRGFPSHGTFS